MALGLAKYRFDVFYDASDVIELGELAIINNQVLFWAVTFKFLSHRFNKPLNFFTDSGSETIQAKEMFAIAVNILAFGHYVGRDTAFCLHTDNLGLAANLAKFRACHDH